MYIKSYLQFLNESIEDKYLLKAIFVTGSPVSGKSFISKILANKKTNTFKLFAEDIFDDKLTEFATFYSAEKTGKNVNIMKDPEANRKNEDLSELIKYFKYNKSFDWLNSLNSIIIEGQDKDLQTMISNKNILESLGYDVSIIFVNTTLETLTNRNTARVRQLSDTEVSEEWNKAQVNLKEFKDEFGKNLVVIDNNFEFNYNHKTHKLSKDSNYDKFKAKVEKIGYGLLEEHLKNPLGIQLLNEIRQNNVKNRFDLKSNIYKNNI